MKNRLVAIFSLLFLFIVAACFYLVNKNFYPKKDEIENIASEIDRPEKKNTLTDTSSKASDAEVSRKQEEQPILEIPEAKKEDVPLDTSSKASDSAVSGKQEEQPMPEMPEVKKKNTVRRIMLSGLWRAKLVNNLPETTADKPHPDKGISEKAKQCVLPDTDDSNWDKLPVPSFWDKCGNYGKKWVDAHGEAVFRWTVDIPEEWAGRELFLSLGPIDDFDDTFFNGELVGHTDKSVPNFYAVPRKYIVPGEFVKAGKNIIAVRVFDHFGGGGICGNSSQLYLEPSR